MNTAVPCAHCGKHFHPKTKRSRLCSRACGHAEWAKKNRTYLNAYQNSRYYGIDFDTKIGVDVPCANCKKMFRRNSGRALFCSVKCRQKFRWKNPEYQEKSLARWRIWVAKNREKYRAYQTEYQRNFYRKMNVSQPWLSLINGSRQRAKKLGLKFDLDSEWAVSRWTGKCELTGIPFTDANKRIGYKLRNFSPSIDKIDSSLGYTKDNCRFVLWAINSLKRDGTDEQMYTIAMSLVANMPKNLMLRVQS